MFFDFGHPEMIKAAFKADNEIIYFERADYHEYDVVVSDGVKKAIVDTSIFCRNDYPHNVVKAIKKALKEEYRKGALNGVKNG